ncbi:MAG: hypothetical protein EOP48_30715, partial [Sphingobacteriales bacterium]
MESVPFKVFPSVGYINSQFQLVQLDSTCVYVIIEKNGSVSQKIYFKEGQIAVMTDFSDPGIYRATCRQAGRVYMQEFEVKNAIRLGASELKSVYVFDSAPYSFFLMKDRLLIYDEKNKQLLTENHISPTSVSYVSGNNLLLKTIVRNEKDEIHNYGLYSLTSFTLIWELKNVYREVAYLEDSHLLWVHNFKVSEIVCYALHDQKEGIPVKQITIPITGAFGPLETSNYWYIDNEDEVLLVHLPTAHVYHTKKKEDTAVDKYGNQYQLYRHSILCKMIAAKKVQSLYLRTP